LTLDAFHVLTVADLDCELSLVVTDLLDCVLRHASDVSAAVEVHFVKQEQPRGKFEHKNALILIPIPFDIAEIGFYWYSSVQTQRRRQRVSAATKIIFFYLTLSRASITIKNIVVIAKSRIG
jgi:hypothetical protein